MKDKYDEAIEYLTDYPELIKDAWAHPSDELYGCLFLFATKDGQGAEDCGCLTQIRGSIAYRAETDELTEAIRNDERIPRSQLGITVADLPVFAEWQRRLDRELRRQQ